MDMTAIKPKDTLKVMKAYERLLYKWKDNPELKVPAVELSLSNGTLVSGNILKRTLQN